MPEPRADPSVRPLLLPEYCSLRSDILTTDELADEWSARDGIDRLVVDSEEALVEVLHESVAKACAGVEVNWSETMLILIVSPGGLPSAGVGLEVEEDTTGEIELEVQSSCGGMPGGPDGFVYPLLVPAGAEISSISIDVEGCDYGDRERPP